MFSISKDNGPFHLYHCQLLSFPSNLSISLSPTSVTTRSGRWYHRQFNPKTLYFHHLEGRRVAAVHEEASQIENVKWTSIHHLSLVPRGRLARGSVPQIIQYIYAPPKTATDQGVLNIYPPLDSNTPPKTHLYITCGTSLTCAAPKEDGWFPVYVGMMPMSG